jgi:feruloyl esterase
MGKRRKLISALTAVLFAPCWSNAAGPWNDNALGAIWNYDPPGQCAALNGMQILPQNIGLPTTGADVTSAAFVPANAAGNTNGDYCLVLGAIHPVDPGAPDINFRVNLPTNWNGKAVQMGGGGYDGNIPNTTGKTTLGSGTAPLTLGYVVFAGDSGHQAKDTNDASFAVNDEALLNFGYMHIKKTRDAAFEIAKARYGKWPKRLYISGGSTGGREGLTAALRWPNDYDGVLSNYPTANFLGLRLWGSFLEHAEYPDQSKPPTDPAYAAGFIPPALANEIAAYAVAQCDGLDGVVDGLVANIPACRALSSQVIDHFKCSATRPTNCLTPAFLARTNEVYHRGYTLPYPLANGITRYEGYNSLESVIMDLGTNPHLFDPVQDGPNAHHVARADQFVKYFVTRDPNFNLDNFDPSNPGVWLDKIQSLSETIDATDPDLSKFMHKGGKIIWLHGTEDPSVAPFANARLYETIAATMGQAQADKFIRFYMVPGLAHGGGNFNPVWENLAALDNWVENGVAPPDKPVALGNPRVAGVPTRERPLCLWPTMWQYVKGDPEKAASFTCVPGYHPARQFDAFP